jgi:phage/plasmid primase-like uncharacterized protein
MTDAATIGQRLGLRKQGRTFHGACPCCGYKSGFTVEDQKGTTLVRCHAGGCPQADVIEALRRQGLWAGERDADWTPPPRRPATDDKAKAEAMTQAARAIWRKTLPAEGTAAETYLRNRGITLPVPATLRYHPACRHTGTGLLLPCMVGAVTVAPGRDVVAIHRTFLTTDGRTKAPVTDAKKSLGPLAGGAVRLAAAGPVLIVGEGIETTLSAMQATGLPGWAALSAGGIRNLILPPLPMAAEVIIAADHDANGVGQDAARAAAARWLAEGRRVRIALPPEPGQDWNDLLRTAAHA